MGTYIDWEILSSYLSRQIDEAEKDNNKSQIKFLRKVYGIMQDFAYIEPKAIKALKERPKTGQKELCEDCISREQAINEIEEWAGGFEEGEYFSGKSVADAIRTCSGIVAELPSVQPKAEEEPKTDWVSANERLPEEGTTVLVWYEYFRYGDYNCMWQTYGIGWQYDGHFNIDNGGASRQRVIAWCELPEEYKESEG